MWFGGRDSEKMEVKKTHEELIARLSAFDDLFDESKLKAILGKPKDEEEKAKIKSRNRMHTINASSPLGGRTENMKINQSLNVFSEIKVESALDHSTSIPLDETILDDVVGSIEILNELNVDPKVFAPVLYSNYQSIINKKGNSSEQMISAKQESSFLVDPRRNVVVKHDDLLIAADECVKVSVSVSLMCSCCVDFILFTQLCVAFITELFFS